MRPVCVPCKREMRCRKTGRVERINRQESAKVKARSGGRCEVWVKQPFVVGTPNAIRCTRYAAPGNHHLQGGNGRRNRGASILDGFAWQMRAVGLPAPEREADFCWRAQRLVVEVDGGTFVSGRHSRGMGQASDCEKQNLLVLAGWRVLRVTTLHVRDGSALRWIEEALK